jgi:hypothetical protein
LFFTTPWVSQWGSGWLKKVVWAVERRGGVSKKGGGVSKQVVGSQKRVGRVGEWWAKKEDGSVLKR